MTIVLFASVLLLAASNGANEKPVSMKTLTTHVALRVSCAVETKPRRATSEWASRFAYSC